MKYHLWYKPVILDKNDNPMTIAPIRKDLGVVVGWDAIFLPYLKDKVAALNHGKDEWYIGDSSGQRIENG